jgi:hypothetical protein
LEHQARLRSVVVTATVTSRPARWAPLAAPLACGCCLAAGAAYVAANDPAQGGAFLPCPFRTLTGWWCPGCGLTRATHHLLRGDLAQALRFNVFVLVVLATVAASWWGWFRRAARRPSWRPIGVPIRFQVVAGIVLVAFGVVRNLPGVTLLRG